MEDLEKYYNNGGGQYQEMRMVTAMTLWHELVHGFVYFMAGQQRPGTPPECGEPWEDPITAEYGESGFFMEFHVWGAAMHILIEHIVSLLLILNIGVSVAQDGYVTLRERQILTCATHRGSYAQTTFWPNLPLTLITQALYTFSQRLLYTFANTLMSSLPSSPMVNTRYLVHK